MEVRCVLYDDLCVCVCVCVCVVWGCIEGEGGEVLPQTPTCTTYSKTRKTNIAVEVPLTLEAF